MPDMKFNHSQKMQQQLKLSPQMIQSIEILRLPVEELCDRVYQEAEKNPAIEIVRDADLSIRSVVPPKRLQFSNASDTFQLFIENAADHEESLQEHLLFQLSILDITKEEKNLGERIIQNLDEHGFFYTPPDKLLYPNETIDFLEQTLQTIRSLEPRGIAFENVQQSLLFQAEFLEDPPPLVFDILQNYFSVLEKKRPPLITKHLNELGLECTIDDVEKAIESIRSLEPYPASQFASVNTNVQYVVPDVIVRKNEDAEYGDNHAFVIDFLKGSLPEITLSPVYTQLLEEKGESKSIHQFTSDAVKDANQFINALKYRATSIYHAMEAIVMHQHEFFSKGPGYLTPLRQKDIAEKIGMHETTISRIANGKYVQCDWGVFELKYFFTNAVQEQKEGNIQESKEAVKHQILLMLEENKNSGGKKLSDSRLATMLEEKGIKIARRTVAKYRSELNIESSFDRL